MARSAVMAGRTIADLVRDVFVVALMCIVGFLVGTPPRRLKLFEHTSDTTPTTLARLSVSP